MKVCTDACFFGAWVADKLASGELKANRILDIGSGTGLLGLMLAQKSSAEIDGVEIDKKAYLQSTDNIAASPWADNIHIYHCALNDFSVEEKYDLIICNPPFYEDQLKSGDAQRDLAMHATALSFVELAHAFKALLSEAGTAAVLLPYDRVSYLKEELTAGGLFITEKINIAHSPTHKHFRSFLQISPVPKLFTEKELLIKDSAGVYSEEFCRLLKDYYLSL